MAYTTLKGRYRPKNPHKYKGDVNNIIYRSGWELQILKMLDESPDVVAFASEETVVIYRSPIDQKQHRYFIDFWYKKRDGKETLVEVKPAAQTRPPRPQQRRTKRFMKEVATYAVNQRKWEAARAYAKARGMTFELLTEENFPFTR